MFVKASTGKFLLAKFGLNYWAEKDVGFIVFLICILIMIFEMSVLTIHI